MKRRKIFIESLAKEVRAAGKAHTLVEVFESMDELAAVAFPALLYNPLMYLAKKSLDITIIPMPLNGSEVGVIWG